MMHRPVAGTDVEIFSRKNGIVQPVMCPTGGLWHAHPFRKSCRYCRRKRTASAMRVFRADAWRRERFLNFAQQQISADFAFGVAAFHQDIARSESKQCPSLVACLVNASGNIPTEKIARLG